MKTKTAKPARGRVVSFHEIAERVKAVAKGEAQLPDWAGETVYASEGARRSWTEPRIVEQALLASLAKLLADNRDLLEAIRHSRPISVAALAKTVHRSDSNVSRSLGKLVKVGIVGLRSAEGKAKQPVLEADRVLLELDVLSGQVAISRRSVAMEAFGDKRERASARKGAKVAGA
jgi:predicted transcriptional regulator